MTPPGRRRALVERLLAGIARRLGGAEVTYIGPDEREEARAALARAEQQQRSMRRVRVKLIGMLRTLDELEDASGEEARARLHAIEEALIEIERELTGRDGAGGGDDGTS